MVLPEGIELSTSPLPRECSTTELRQRAGRGGGSRERRGPCHSGSGGASKRSAGQGGAPTEPSWAKDRSSCRRETKSDTLCRDFFFTETGFAAVKGEGEASWEQGHA